MLTQFRRLLVVAAAMCISPSAALAQASDTVLPAVTIESGKAQLFVDDYLIASQSDLERTLRQPKKDGGGHEPVIAIDDEFGETKSTLEANGTILYDPMLKKWVMFALAFASNWPGSSADRVRLYRFTSEDAMNWVKGDDGKPQRIAIDLHDLQSNTSATNIDLFSCTYDENDRGHPYKGWLFFANWGAGREGTYYVQSPDGIHWTRGPQVLVAGSRSIEQDGRKMNGTGDVTTFHHDKEQNRFLGCLRFASATDVENTNRLRSRGFIFTDRLDRQIDLQQVTRLNLIPEGAQRHGDMPTDEYYSSTAWRYGSLWLGGLRVWHSRDDYPYSASGSAFMKLLVSRDGLHWKKVPFKNEDGFPEVLVPNGKEGGNDARNDGGYMTEFSNAPLRIGDELIYYYGSSSWGKNHPRPYRVSGGGIFRARLRPDGFVSVDRGSLITRRLKFDGRELYVNGVGPVTVEAVTLAENTVTKIAQATIGGDSLNHKVVFDDHQSLCEVAANGMVQFRFTVGEGGALYSFTIDPRRTEVSTTAKGQSLAQRSVTGDNALCNGDFHDWKDYKGGVSTESVGTPPNTLPTHWYGGPGVGAIATYDRIEVAPANRDGAEIDRWAFRVAWSKPQSDKWPGETHHSPTFRFTFLESFEIADVRKFAGKNVRMSFFGRSPTGKVEIVPILWHSYDANTPGIKGVKGKGYELFESSGQWNQVAVAQGPARQSAKCELGPHWQRFEKTIALPAVGDKSITPGHYTGVGFDLVARGAPTIELATIEVREVPRGVAPD